MRQKKRGKNRSVVMIYRIGVVLLTSLVAVPLGAADAGGANTVTRLGPAPWVSFSFQDPVPSWTMEEPFEFSSEGSFLEVTDLGVSGHRYEVYDLGELIGTTTLPSNGAACGPEPEACFGDHRMSTAVIPLKTGDHSLSFRMIQAPPGIQHGKASWRLRDPALEGPPPPTTIISHGFQLSGSFPPSWTFWLARALVDRSGGGRILLYNKEWGLFDPCDASTHLACDFVPSTGLVAIVFDWVTDSNNTGDGWSEAAGEALAAALLRAGIETPQLVDLDRLHFIGHSRGTVVHSEAIERLLKTGLAQPVQVTTLDPHDNGGFPLAPEDEHLLDSPDSSLGGWDDLDVNSLHPDYLCGDPPGSASGICSWVGSGFHDNYWRSGFPPSGKPIPGTAEFAMNGLSPGVGHSDVHYWYYFTADSLATAHPDSTTPESTWWNESGTCPASGPRQGALARAVDGYNLASHLGGEGNRCVEEGSKQEVLFDFLLTEGIVNGDFEKSGSSGQAIPGWTEHGQGGLGTVNQEGGNAFLTLEGGEWQEHSPTWTPDTVNQLSFCRRVNQIGGQGEVLSISLISEQVPDASFVAELLYEETLVEVGDWQCFQRPVVGLGQTAAIRIELVGGDPGVEVDLDQFRWIFGSITIFTDGFESGDTSAWSSTSLAF